MFTGDKLRLLRLIKGLKQQSVAYQLGITQQAYSKLEKKDVIRDQLMEKIIQCMHCTPEDMETVQKLSATETNSKRFTC